LFAPDLSYSGHVPSILTYDLAALLASQSSLFTGKLMRFAHFMRFLATPRGNLTPTFWTHGSETSLMDITHG
jgi:hypothetical protein